MSFSFSTNITDIVKGLVGITVVILLIAFAPKIMDRLDGSSTVVDKTTIESIASNVIKVHLAESDKDLKALLKELKKENNEAILLALNGQDARIKEIADLVANMQGSTNPDPDTEVVYGEKDDPKRLETFVVHRTDADGEQYPTGIVYYSPNVKEGPKFSYQQYPLDIHTTIVSSEEGEEEKRTAAFWVENNFVSTSKGNKYALHVDPKNIRWAKAEPNDKSFMFNPRVSFLGVIDSNSEIFPALEFSFFSYGRTKGDMDWKLLSVGVGGTGDIYYVTGTLFSYNIGIHLPLVKNMFLGPYFNYNSDNETTYGIGISVPF